MIRIASMLSLSLRFGGAFATVATAQQINGVPGAPSATVTIEGASQITEADKPAIDEGLKKSDN
jgi:hypothetical protein